MSGFIKECTIIIVLVLCGAAFSLYSKLMPLPWEAPELAAGEIEVENARILDLIWIDARKKDDYDTDHIPDAILLNNSNWDNGIGNLMEKWLNDMRPIVVYCSNKECDASKKIALRLRETIPEAEVYSLKGGWEAWEK